MVRPRYIICSEGRVIDQATKLISHFNVIDQITVSMQTSTVKTAEPRLVGLALELSAVWMKEDESEKEVDYETEVRLFSPGGDEPQVARLGTFRFGEHYYHRINMTIRPGPAGEESAVIELREGMMRLECRIRPLGGGETDWISQDYLIPVKVNRPDSPEPQADSSGA